jgi:hypothetical protein
MEMSILNIYLSCAKQAGAELCQAQAKKKETITVGDIYAVFLVAETIL